MKINIAGIVIIFIFCILSTACEAKPKRAAIKSGAVMATPNSTSEKIKPVAKATKVTFVELGSKGCMPCRMMQPVMDAIEKEYPETVNVVFYDIWTESGKAKGTEYRVRVIPTQVFLDETGQEFFRHEGFLSKEEIVKILKNKGL